jgi:hypothetical protein
VFLMTCPRTAAHEETELLTVPKIPFRVRTPIKVSDLPLFPIPITGETVLSQFAPDRVSLDCRGISTAD